MANLQPRFQAERIVNRTVTEHVYKRERDEFDEKRTKLVPETKETVYPESFMVYFPSGHSTWFASREHMQAAGLLDGTTLIDMDTGLPEKPPTPVDLKAHVAKSTRETRITR